jgi:hypothetical protein
MSLNSTFQKAAATIAQAIRQGNTISSEALETLASNHQEARDALSLFGATRYARQLPKTGEVKPLSGQNILLYKTPLPSEQQAKLSYEYLISEFSDFLRRKVCAVVMSESAAHLAIWLPNGATLELDKLWQPFIGEMTSAIGLSKGFGLVMNSSKLSDRGFSTLEAPMVSEAQPEAIAAFYIANLKYVEQRIQRRQRIIERTKPLIDNENDDKKRASLEKQLVKDQDMQTKELEKYKSEFTKMFGRLLQEQIKLQKEAAELERQIAEADAKTRKKSEKQLDKIRSQLYFDAETVTELQSIYQPDAFGFMNALSKHQYLASTWQSASNTARQYSETAANQLSTQKGDIYAKIIWETCVLLYGKITISPLEPLVSLQPIQWGMRLAGDNQSECCYSCGKPIDKDNSFRSRRLLFESPEQRAQSGGSSGAVQVCTTCAALSVLSPVKFAPDTLVIRFNANERDVQERVKQALEQQALNEIGASAGRYINITCTEKLSDGTPASQKLGMKQYAIAKLASLYPENVLRHLQPSLYSGGQEIPLRSSVLVATSVLMEVFQQYIKDGSDINMKLGEAIRLLENDGFVKASYLLGRVRGATQTRILEDGTKLYDDMLEKEEGMNKQARILADTHAMVGLLMPFCRQLLARTDLGMDDTTKWREVGKLIQSIDENPTVFSYNTGKTVGGVGNLTRDYNTHFVFDKAKALIQELGELPPYTDKDGETNDDPNKLRVTNDLIARAYEYILNKDIYHSDYDRKNFFYQVKLGLYARFPEAAKPKGDR